MDDEVAAAADEAMITVDTKPSVTVPNKHITALLVLADMFNLPSSSLDRAEVIRRRIQLNVHAFERGLLRRRTPPIY